MKKTLMAIVVLSCVMGTSQTQPNYDLTAGEGNGLRFWNGNNNYKIHMGSASEYRYGPVNDYSIKMNMNNDDDRGWTWGVVGQTPIAALNTQGSLQIAKDFYALGNVGIGITNPGTYKLSVKGHVNIGHDGNYKLRVRHIDGKQTNSTGLDDLFLNYNTGENVRVGFGSTNSKSNLYLSGRLGIGFTSPTHHIDVRNDIDPTEAFLRFRVQDAPNDYFSIVNSTGAAGQLIPALRGYRESDNRYSIQLLGITSDANDTGSNALVNFDARRNSAPIQNRPLFVWTNYTNKMMTMLANGNLGIGTTTPYDKLEVKDGRIRVSNGNDRMYLSVDNDNSKSMIAFGDDLNDRLDFYFDYWNGSANDKEIMSLLANGRVGIGTTLPDAKLAVNGDIHAEEVKVDLNVPGPDYVFKEGYDLKSLEEVQNHIKQHGHLPNIPSAEEMEANGIKVGEMNMKLLEKIEELTLYSIQQEKHLQEKDEQINMLFKKFEILEQQVKAIETKN